MTKRLDEWDTDANNNNFTPPDGFPENMNYSAVNNADREKMAVLARWFRDTNGSLAAGGTPNALTLTPNATYAAYAQGMRFSFKAASNNTSSATINIGGLGAVALIQADGDPLDEDAIRAGLIYDIVYTGTSFQIVGSSALGPGFGLANRPVESKTLVYLTAEKAMNSEEIISWDAESYDEAAVWVIGSPTVFTIPAALNGRRVRLRANVVATNYPDSVELSVTIQKNGSEDYLGAGKSRIITDTGNPAAPAETAWITVATGDIFRVAIPNTLGAITLDGNLSWFQLEVEPITGIPYNLNAPAVLIAPGNILADERLLGPHAFVELTAPASWVNSVATLETAPSASTAFSIQDDGVTIGTITFAASATTATFSAESEQTVAVGSKLSILAPSNLNGAIGLSATLLFTYEFNG